MAENTTQDLLSSILELEDQIVLGSKRDYEDRLHAITELRYYRKLLGELHKYTQAESNIIFQEFRSAVQEIFLWFQKVN
jgi:flagellar biosynthesis regulator FlaF